MNPFSYGAVVKDPYFYDRKKENRRIVSTLSGGNNLVLFAPRRYGKTSLVFRAIEKLEKMNFVCIYFDFMPIYSRESFIEAYSKAILSKQSNIQKAVKKVAELVKGIRPSLSFDTAGKPVFSMTFTDDKLSEKTLEDILDLPERIASEAKRYIVVMDEFQEITKLNGDNFEKLLRSKVQQHQHVNYLFLGSRTHLLSDMFNNKGRAFYNSAMLMQIETLPVHDSIEFLKSRFESAGALIDDQTARYLIEEAGNIPYYIQLLAAEVWQDIIVSTSKKIHKNTIAVCAERIVTLKNDYYTEVYDRQSAYQKKILNALVISGENVFSADYAKRFRLSAVSTTQKALIGLVESGVIEKVEGQYFIGDPFFKRFLLHYA
jgi:AAA+ ATPase superfamily predicted ATPase